MMKRNFRLIFLTFIWCVWIALILFLNEQKIDSSKLSVKNGTAIAASCIESRSVHGVKFEAIYSGETSVVNDFFSLPADIICDQSLLNKFKNKPIKIIFYKNYYLDINVDNSVVRSLDKSINEINDKSEIVYFTLFLSIFFSLILTLRSKIS